MRALAEALEVLTPGTVISDGAGQEWVVDRRTWDASQPSVATLTVILIVGGSEHDPRIKYADLQPTPPERTP